MMAVDAVWAKIKADILGWPLISALIVVAMVASTTLLTLALATLMNTAAPYDQAFESLNGAHLWLFFDRETIRWRDIQRIEALPGVVASTGLRYSVPSRVRVGGGRVLVSLRAVPAEGFTVNRLLVQEGRGLIPGRDETLVSRDLDYLYDTPVGSSIGVIRNDGREVALPAIGLAYNPTWDIYRNSQPPYVYVNRDTLQDLFPDESTWEWSLGMRLADPHGVDEMLALIEQTLHRDVIESHVDWRDVRESAIFEVQLNLILLGTFSLLGVVAALFVLGTSVSSAVISQIRQIGILKAIGFTRRQVVAVYLGKHLLLGLIGGSLGLGLGAILSPLPLRSAAVSLSTSYRPPMQLSLILLVVTVVLAVVITAALGAARRGAETNVIQAITKGAEPPNKQLSWVGRVATNLGLPPPVVLGLNDVFARPLRSILTGLNLALGVMGIVCGLALNQTLRDYRDNPAQMGIVYDAVVTRQVSSDSRTQRMLRRSIDVAAYYREVSVEAKTRQEDTFQIRAVDGDLAAFPFPIVEGRFFRPGTDEALAGQGLLDWLGIAVGDELTVVLDEQEDRPVTYRIVGRYTEPGNAGQMLMVDLAGTQRVLRHVEPSTYYLKLVPGANLSRLRNYLMPTPDADLSVSFVGLSVPDSVVYLQLALFALACILIGIALINVFSTSWLAIQERVRVVGILKTLGMTPLQVITMINTSAGFLGLAAVVLGFPVGLVLTEVMLAVLARYYGFGAVDVSLSLVCFFLLLPTVGLTSVIGSLVPAWWASRLSVLSVIRRE